MARSEEIAGLRPQWRPERALCEPQYEEPQKVWLTRRPPQGTNRMMAGRTIEGPIKIPS